jgi:hypothetical protein
MLIVSSMSVSLYDVPFWKPDQVRVVFRLKCIPEIIAVDKMAVIKTKALKEM